MTRTPEQEREDFETYSAPVQLAPMTRMTAEEAQELVNLLSHMPIGAGFIISHVITPVGAPQMFGGYSATVILQGGWAGESMANNPAIAFRRAWARAHAAASKALTP